MNKLLQKFQSLVKGFKKQVRSYKRNKAKSRLSIVNTRKSVTDAKCKNCDKSLNNSIRSSISEDKTYYYARCSCGFVNKISNNISIIPDATEIKIAYNLFKKNGVIFHTYSLTKDSNKEIL